MHQLEPGKNDEISQGGDEFFILSGHLTTTCDRY